MEEDGYMIHVFVPTSARKYKYFITVAVHCFSCCFCFFNYCFTHFDSYSEDWQERGGRRRRVKGPWVGLWRVAGALKEPNRSGTNWYKPYRVEKAVFSWTLQTCESASIPWLNPVSWKAKQCLTGSGGRRPGKWDKHQTLTLHSRNHYAQNVFR